MLDVILALVFGFAFLRYILPAFSAFTEVFRDEMKRIDREGLMKTNGEFWSPNKDINPRHR